MSDSDNGTREAAVKTGEAAKDETRDKGYDPRQYAPGTEPDTDESEYEVEKPEIRKSRYGFRGWTLAALSPFAYVLLGMAFGWWAWAWVIIPVCGVIGTPMKFWLKAVSISPFIYVLLGMAFGWWSWAWIIIPVCGVLSSGIYERK